MKIVFFSTGPHNVHKEFAKSIKAEIKIIPFKKFFKLVKKIPLIGYVYPLMAFFYSLSLDSKDKIILNEGSAGFYIISFLKLRNRKIKFIHLDADLVFYNIIKYKKKPKLFQLPLKMIDGVVSVSEKNKSYVEKVIKIPIEVAPPFPINIKKTKIKRENFGLYIGRLDPEKNIKKVIEFAKQCSFFEKFIIVGSGVLKNYVKKECAKNQKLIYMEHDKYPSKYYAKCKFLVHLAEADSHPCTIMEAALCGCFPIISENIGNSYLFHNRFKIKDINNFKEINKKIEKILENENGSRKILKKDSKKIITKKQSIENFKNKFRKLIKNVASESP